MNSFLTLFSFDFKTISFWLSKRPVSKLIVIAGFFIVFALVDKTIYSGAVGIFSLFKSSGIFGILTALYMLHASIIVLTWFATGSTILATAGRFLRVNTTINFLITFPVSPVVITAWTFSKTLLMNFILLSLFIVPVAVGFADVFLQQINVPFLIAVIMVVATMAFFTTGVGTILGYVFISFFRTSVKKSLILSGILFLLSGIFLVQLIYPPNLKLLESARGNFEFESAFHQLPLGNQMSPTYWLADSIVSGLEMRLFVVLATVVLLTIAIIFYIGSRYISVFQRLQEYRLLKESNKKHGVVVSTSLEDTFKSTQYPVLVKDLISIIRLPSEIGYAIFIASLTGIFFALLFVISGKIVQYNALYEQIILFFFSSLMFFTTAYLLRFSFPLIAREGNSAWFIFTQPISKNRLLNEKLVLSLLLASPFFILSILVWGFAQFVENHLLFITVSIITLITLVCSTVIIGATWPNFSDAKDTEKISTSGMGLFSLATSIVIVAVNEYMLVHSMQNPQLQMINIFITVLGNLAVLLFLYIIFERNNNYQF